MNDVWFEFLVGFPRIQPGEGFWTIDQVHLGTVTEAALDVVAVDWEELVEKMDHGSCATDILRTNFYRNIVINY